MRRGPKSKYFVPDKLARLGNLQLLARTVVEGYISGLHRSPFKGFSTEFAEYRPYSQGDDLKHLDWKVYARTDKRYIRQYEEETNMTCTLLLDGSGSMAYGSNGMSKFQYGCFLCAALTYLMVHQHDQVGLVLFADGVRARIPPRSSPAHMKYVLDRLEEFRPGGRTAIADSLHAIAASLKQRGLVVVISDLVDDQDAVMNALQHFRHDRHEVIVFNVLDRAELEFPFRGLLEFRDMETRQRLQTLPEAIREDYLQNLKQFIDRYRRDCRKAAVDYQLVCTDTPFELMLAAYLSKREKTK